MTVLRKSVERRRKLAEIDAAARTRGFRVYTDTGRGLTHSPAGWRLELARVQGVPKHIASTPTLIMDDYAALLKTLADDLAWARFVHDWRAQPLERAQADAVAAYEVALNVLTQALRRREIARLEGDDPRPAANDCAVWRATAADAYRQLRDATAQLWLYRQQCPDTPAQATAYLASVLTDYTGVMPGPDAP